MALYVRTRDGCCPLLGWPMWKHIACGKLQLTEELAWLYLESFDLLLGRSAEERLEWAEGLSQCSSKAELDQQRGKVRDGGRVQLTDAAASHRCRKSVRFPIVSSEEFSSDWTKAEEMRLNLVQVERHPG